MSEPSGTTDGWVHQSHPVSHRRRETRDEKEGSSTTGDKRPKCNFMQKIRSADSELDFHPKIKHTVLARR
ncbi:hypothetical protein RJT34_24869 [Clitoria ternatea]|uniref:Uncharacterized protein n=1 Tax=Clitoria ternatea TaxID=43366 RepID=A0AAN9FRI8_CLITE